MKLYLVRHGEAVSRDVDPDCPLSAEGRAHVEEIAGILAMKDQQIGRIESSTKARAIQTAEIIARKLGAEAKLLPRNGLKPGDPIDVVMEEHKNPSDRGDRMLVGHLPYMEKMASALLSGSPSAIDLRFIPSTVVCLSSSIAGSGPWTLEWMITPSV